jgi:hypothetical protein
MLEAWVLIIYLAHFSSAGGPAIVATFPSFDWCMQAARNIEAEYQGPRRQSVKLVSFNCVRIG